MDNILGIGMALDAMRPDAGARYERCLILSALPHAPTVEHRPALVERIRSAVQQGRSLPRPDRST